MSNETAEQMIQRKDLSAPRVTPADVEQRIADEFFFTAGAAVQAATGLKQTATDFPSALRRLTICVLVLKSGFTVVGSACASPENYDAEVGRKVAREDAVRQCWPLLEKLSSEKTP